MGSLPNYINNTTMDTPYVRARLAADGIQAPAGETATMSQPWLNAAPVRQESMIRNPNFDPNDPWSGPEMIQNPTATATPTAFSNSAGTTGVLNPFGLTQNNASAGYYGAPAPPPAAATPPPAAAAAPVTTPPPADAGGVANTTSADDNRPPDQRGFEGNYNPTTGMTGYATPKGVFMMDQGGNWFSQDGSPVDFDQSQSGAPPVNNAPPPTSNEGGVDPVADAAAHPGMMQVNGQWMPGQTTPSGVQPPPAGGTPGAQSNSPFQTGVTSSSIDPKTGQMRYDPTNPNQFATQDAANSLATRYGGTAYGLQLQGPGMGFSAPMQQVRFGNGNQINAGLATQALGRPEYGGGAPGSYGDYMVSRDVNSTYGGGYDQWARSQPGFRENPRLANTGAIGNQYQHAAPPPPQQQQQQPYYPQQQQQYYPQQRPASTAQAGAEQYQQYQAPSQGYYGQQGGYYGPQQGNQQYASYQTPQYDQQYGQQAYQDSMRAQNYYQGQSGQPQYQTSRQSQQNPYYQTQQPQYQQGQQSYYGGNTRQPQQSYSQQPSYTAGTSSTYKSPYGGGYVNYSSPTQSKAGGYMQTGKTTF